MLIRKNEIVPERSVILILYGTPGSGKTSLACTSNEPLLIDTDRGYDRACVRVDTVVASQWEDVYNAEIFGDSNSGINGIIKNYHTVIVDTAKALLDDYLSAFVIKQNYKLQTNSLKRYGEMGELFKNFVNILRSKGVDCIFICHDKETVEGDIIKHSPDCTGQSKDLLIRIADQVGYVCIENGKRVIKFEPVDTRVGKNVAQLGDMQVPDSGSDDFTTCMASIINKVKDAIHKKGGAQIKALADLDLARSKLSEADTAEKANALIEIANRLAKVNQRGFKNEMIKAFEQKGLVFDKEAKKFVESYVLCQKEKV